jgi:hypothetical protein
MGWLIHVASRHFWRNFVNGSLKRRLLYPYEYMARARLFAVFKGPSSSDIHAGAVQYHLRTHGRNGNETTQKVSVNLTF